MAGNFVWYELLTSDPAAAENFYRDVVGWGARDAEIPDMHYTLFTNGAAPVAGMMQLPPMAREAGVRPDWIGYISVDDVDAFVRRIQQAGGKLDHGPEDIHDIGRFAVVADPQGASFALFKAKTDGPAPVQNTPGGIGWHELHAADWPSAFAFYSALFGWEKADAVDMGPMGTYQLFGKGGPSIGGIFNKPPNEPVPYWLYYFNVAAIDAAGTRVKDKGGRVTNGPHQVPGGSWIIHCLDPQGAIFALVAPAK